MDIELTDIITIVGTMGGIEGLKWGIHSWINRRTDVLHPLLSILRLWDNGHLRKIASKLHAGICSMPSLVGIL